MVAKELAPLGRGRSRLGGFHRLDQWPRIGRRKGVEQVLVDLEVEHHMHAVTVVAEILHIGLRENVRLGEYDAVALPPLQEFAEGPKHVILLLWVANLGSLGADYKGHRVHAEAGYTELNPESHDLEHLGLDLGVRGVEVGLKFKEPVKVV